MTHTPEDPATSPATPPAASDEHAATTPAAQPARPASGGGDPLRGSLTSGIWAALVAFGVVLVLLVVFIAQNTERVLVRFLGFEGETPLAVALLIAVAAGLLLTALAGTLRLWQVRRRVRRETKRSRR
ncbi:MULTISPECIES: lipopolysaccharide assembly protein LapA domain-containing protein [unclassified Nocardioides]|uniref:lipopolysaccharide assembly protein LapA domain-containing protein n=1 Tax=unclassified Nocardioides TaxID=2615069 RepID=UPI002666E72A|nr:lipopolysaccharide assembly protein LapA domain-containing protein [Nocardioides sp. Arc9.136]WKN48590.1 lipopolysaccharide assembly protein LapA domain-containing protein [Nocardioides sp. Arc9.136]